MSEVLFLEIRDLASGIEAIFTDDKSQLFLTFLKHYLFWVIILLFEPSTMSILSLSLKLLLTFELLGLISLTSPPDLRGFSMILSVYSAYSVSTKLSPTVLPF
jgi:hypothetical protein